jgi:hypothetical protein
VKKDDNELIDISKSKLPTKQITFTNFRKDLHPVVSGFNAKKRKLEATGALVMMSNNISHSYR